MSRYVLAIGLGPVEQFIGAGRRSRDLWYGSQWLSNLCAHLANIAIDRSHDHVGEVELWQPRPSRVLRVFEADRPMYHRAALPNRLVLEIRSQEGQNAVLGFARELREEAFRWFADEVKEGCARRGGMAAIESDSFDRQLDAIKAGDFIEFFAAVSEPVGSDAELGRAMAQAQSRIGEAKTVRTFLPAAFSRAGRPKSDLDAGRDSILRESSGGEVGSVDPIVTARKRAGVRKGEQLDAIGFARRMAMFRDINPDTQIKQANLGRLPFPPLSRVTADPWIRGHSQKKKQLQLVSDALGSLMNDNRAGDEIFWLVSSPAWDEWGGAESLFPWDASLLFEGGLESAQQVLKQYGVSPPYGLFSNLVSEVRKLPSPLPLPYYALLTFDGDGVGQALREMSTDKLKAAYEALDTFADEAALGLGGKEVRGCLFYVGGDEGMAYVPLDRLPTAVDALQEAYRHARGALEQTSLSIGAVVAHFKDDLRGVRAVASSALKRAKEGRRQCQDGADSREGWICVRFQPRGGHAIETLAKAEDWPKRVEEWQRALGESELGLTLAQGIVGDLRPAANGEEDISSCAFRAYRGAKLRLSRSGRESEHFMRVLRECRTPAMMESLAAELIIADRVARAAAQALGAAEGQDGSA